MLLLTGAIPTSGILPDRVSELTIQADPQNGADAFVSDSNNANSEGHQLLAGQSQTYRAIDNGICLKDFYLKGNALKFNVTIIAR
jgi:hypothetical protein